MEKDFHVLVIFGIKGQCNIKQANCSFETIREIKIVIENGFEWKAASNVCVTILI